MESDWYLLFRGVVERRPLEVEEVEGKIELEGMVS